MTALLLALAVWLPQQNASTAGLRGLKPVGHHSAWASGTKGTFLRTVNGGQNWEAGTVSEAGSLDFRAVEAFDSNTAWLMSAGEGDQSRIYRTDDAGKTWRLLFTNPDPKGFWDCLRFWDKRHGILVGDPVQGRMTIFTTDDAGDTWQRQVTQESLEKEGAFAASNSSLTLLGESEAWFGTGSPSGARVFHTMDRGRTWWVARAPLSGIFSLVFLNPRDGVAVGGDYTKPASTDGNAAITTDGGFTWKQPASRPSGYRSSVAFDGKVLVAVGTTGSDVSRDKGKTWKPLDAEKFNVAAFGPGGHGWAAGPEGRISVWKSR